MALFLKMEKLEHGSTAASTQTSPATIPSRVAIARASSSLDWPRLLVWVSARYRYGRPASAARALAWALSSSVQRLTYRLKFFNSTCWLSRNAFMRPGALKLARCPLKISRSKQHSLPATRSW